MADVVLRRGATVTPFLFYEDVESALDWLSRVFGFRERWRLTTPAGAIAHAEIELDGGIVMIGNVGGRNRQRPSTVRTAVYVYVDDVDAHCARARAAGAQILDEPADLPFGDRLYLAADAEGHEWYFAQHLRDVALDDVRRGLAGGRRPPT